MADPGTPIPVLVLCGDTEPGETLRADLDAVRDAGAPDDPVVRVGLLMGRPDPAETWRKALAECAATALLVRHVDVLSLDRIREIHALLGEHASKPFCILVLRNDGEADFKMSCPHCGQKIWVRDSDVNKRGRCPNCKKGFNLPSQIRHLRANLQLPEEVPVAVVVKGNGATARSALAALAGSLAGASGKNGPGVAPAGIRIQLD